MRDNFLGGSEYKLMEIIWDNAPIPSGELAILCEQIHGWKRTTVYTMVKRLSDKELIKSEKSNITYIKSRSEIQKQQSEDLVKRNFMGSLPMFVSAFLGDKSLSKEDATKLIDMIEQHTED